MKQIICIAGPTASGKTALAVALAQRLNGEVISCDSMQIYRRMNIGTAKPDTEEMQGIPHHMLDAAEPWEDFSVSRYCAEADRILQDILARGRTAVIAGGTGLYMDNLIRGTSFASAPTTGVRQQLEEQADAQGMEIMLARLKEIDPVAAARLHPADRKRILRALEIFLETGETITEHDRRTRETPPKYDPVWLGLDFDPRSLLYDRINRRVDLMLQAGLVDEIRALFDSGLSPKCTAMQAIGYKEFAGVLMGSCSIEDAAEQVRQASRHYAKRQLTWFRRNPAMNWLTRREDTTEDEILDRAMSVIAQS